MRLIESMADMARKRIRSFLKIEPAQCRNINITETLDRESNAIKNRIWYRGDAEELEQLYHDIGGSVNQSRFWSAVPQHSKQIRRIHTGLPSMIIDVITSIVMNDIGEITVDDMRNEEWKSISDDNNFYDMLSDAITDTLVVGDGAFKITFDTAISKYPIIEFVSGENVEIVMLRGRIREVVFKTVYTHEYKTYTLFETYGFGCINSELRNNGNIVPLNSIPETEQLSESVTFDESFMMAIPFKIYKSNKWKGRGRSIIDSKTDNFDAFDEVFSQWMDAIRLGRSKEYIPEDMLPRDPESGKVVNGSAFEAHFLTVTGGMAEGTSDKIELVQPAIPHESYLATYITALDLCLQGIISPSTLGIDTKKLDNAEAQREKEKTTLYTRQNIVESLQNTIPVLVNIVLKSYDTWHKQKIEDVTVDVPFGEYANPSFESQVETVAKAKQGGIMSIEASVDELYGDSKDEEWKADEVERIKSEQGITMMEEPATADEMEGVIDEGQGNEQNIQNES